MTELGKFGKKIGQQHPSVLRRLDPMHERPTPKAKPHRKSEKPYGFEYEITIWRKRRTHRQWYRTVKSRDQAMSVHNKTLYDWVTAAKPIGRTSVGTA